MMKKREHDPELSRLLEAFREVHPSLLEKNQWRVAIAAELKELHAPAPAPKTMAPQNHYRFIVRTAIQVGVAAGIGFVVGATIIEKRYNQGQTMLFSQTAGATILNRPPNTMDEQREIVRINLDSEGHHGKN